MNRSRRSFTSLLIEGLESRSMLSAVNFAVDASKSFATLSGTSFPLTAQAKNSLTAHYAGTIKTDITGSMIQFKGGTATAKATGKYKPTPTVSSEYGAIAAGSLFTDIQNLALTLTSSKATAISSAGKFSASGEKFAATAGKIVVGSSSSSQLITNSLIGLGALNKSTTQSTLVKQNGVYTLTIAVSVTLNYKLNGQFAVPVKLTGTIVATAKA